MSHYSIGKLAELAGVSIRTLRYYDRIGLLKPAERTRARYRLYGEEELLRLQQILFYKELDFSLKKIREILDNPDFDVVQALKTHKSALKKRQQRIDKLLVTIDRTITKLNDGAMLNHEELYDGLPKEKAEAWRSEAVEKWGKGTIEQSETSLRNMSKDELQALKDDFTNLWKKLASLSDQDPESTTVQDEIARHYKYLQQFWGRKPDAEAYKGLAELYINDKRYTTIDEEPKPKFARFLSRAMSCFADTHLS